MTTTIRESINRMNHLVDVLVSRGVGVTAENLSDLMEEVSEYKELRESLVDARSTQFLDDAYDLTDRQCQTPSENARITAAWLRSFAAEIVEQTLRISQESPKLKDWQITDQLIPMSRIEKHEKAA